MPKDSLLETVANRFIEESIRRLFSTDSLCAQCDPIGYLDGMLTKHEQFLSECIPVFRARRQSPNTTFKPCDSNRCELSSNCIKKTDGARPYPVVLVSEVEADLIFRTVFKSPAEKLDRDRVLKIVKKIEDYKEDDMCIFLDGQRCEIESVRPLKCRLTRPSSFFGLQDSSTPPEVDVINKRFFEHLRKELGDKIFVGGKAAIDEMELKQKAYQEKRKEGAADFPDSSYMAEMESINVKLRKNNNLPLILKQTLISSGYPLTSE